jgi:hypothetical protein
MTMKLNINQEYWNELKTKLRKKYPQLEDIDFQHREGKEESMLRMIEYKLRKSKEQMKEIIAGL